MKNAIWIVQIISQGAMWCQIFTTSKKIFQIKIVDLNNIYILFHLLILLYDKPLLIQTNIPKWQFKPN
jgi:hypothetical protein